MNKSLSIFAAVCAAVSAFAQGVSLDGEWSLSFWKQPTPKVETPAQAKPEKTIKAVVPGNVEIDMLAAKLIDDPMVGDNVYKLRKYEGYQWLYSRTFEAPELAEGERAILNMRGVDTLAGVFINGQKVASLKNMLIGHKIDITDFLKKGENKIDVLIDSVVIEASKYSYPVAARRGVHSEGLEIRKAPHMFGWDIMPRLLSAGLWKSVSVDIQKPTRLEESFWFTRKVDLKKKTARLGMQFRIVAPFDKLDSLRYNVTLSRNGKVQKIAENARFETWNVSNNNVLVENADFWWPRTMGEPALYDAKIELLDGDGKVLDSSTTKVGLRTVRLERRDITADDKGKFQFYVNGVDVFAFGTNWVQIDGLHSRDAKLIGGVLEMMKDLNCNMARCWGGNVYECREFYDFCDANGIMIWQDFSMGCSLSAQSDNFKKQIFEEAVAVVRNLRNHPSLVLWAGNNENDAFIRWAMNEFNMNPADDEISRVILPRVLFSEDFTRPYLPSSPYISPEVYKNPKEVFPAEEHLWGPRGYYKAPFYKNARAIFTSEIGYHGCPNRESLEKMFDKDFVYPWLDAKNLVYNKQWQCKATMSFPFTKVDSYRNPLMAKQVRILFGDSPTDLDEFIDASQFVQAEAKKYFIEMMRSRKGERSGILWWNLRDGWPIISDAIVDYYNSKKLAYYYIKRVQENEVVMITDNFDVVCANETLKPCRVSVEVVDVESGAVLLSLKDVDMAANSAKTLANVGKRSGQGMLLIKYDVDGKKRLNHYLYGEPPFKLSDYKKWYKALDIKRY